MEKTKKNFIVLFCSIVLIAIVTFLARFTSSISIPWLRIATLVSLNLLPGLIAFLAMKLMKMRIAINLKKGRQYLIGLILAIALSLTIAVVPAICGFSLVGNHLDFSWFTIIYNFLFFLLVIGPIEEFVFRVYLQDVFTSFFRKNKWIGVIIAAFLFGLWHIINGNLLQVLFTFGIGLIFGFTKHLNKHCGYGGVALAHGLYDFLNIIVRIFIVG